MPKLKFVLFFDTILSKVSNFDIDVLLISTVINGCVTVTVEECLIRCSSASEVSLTSCILAKAIFQRG